jgi:IS30 family transposase
LDRELGLLPDQKTSVEVIGLGCLLAVFLPFELAAWLLEQFSGIRVSKSTIWEWVQSWGQKAMNQLEQQLQLGSDGHPPQAEPLAEAIAALPKGHRC